MYTFKAIKLYYRQAMTMHLKLCSKHNYSYKIYKLIAFRDSKIDLKNLLFLICCIIILICFACFTFSDKNTDPELQIDLHILSNLSDLERAGVIGFSINDSIVIPRLNYSNLCSVWEIYSFDNEITTSFCHGSAKCCEFIDFAPSNDKWDNDVYIFESKYGIAKNNSISARLLYVDYSLDHTDIYSEIYYSDKAAIKFLLPTLMKPISELLLIQEDDVAGLYVHILKLHLSFIVDSDAVQEDRSVIFNLSEFAALNITGMNITFNATIKDAAGNDIEAHIEFYDTSGNIEESISLEGGQADKDNQFKATKVKNRTAVNLHAGKHKVIIKPVNHIIKNITIEDYISDSDVEEFIKMEELNISEHEELGSYVQAYAIDPTAMNFTTANVTVIAKGTTLYKCREWNFSEQECYGEWNLFKTGLVPGQEYTFELTPDDPAFGEVNESTYYLFNASDSQYPAYHQMKNESVGITGYTSAPLDLSVPGVVCFPEKWIAPNWTTQTIVNGTWNFSIFGDCSASNPDAFLFAKILKYNGTEYNPFNTTTATSNICAAADFNNWGDNVPYSDDLNLSSGERVGVQFCVNITGAAAKFAYIQWENTEYSYVKFPSASLIIDNELPQITLLGPSDNYTTGPTDIDFTFKAVDISAPLNCSIYIDDVLNQTNESTSSDTTTLFTVPGLSIGNHSWFINCTDTEDNSNISETRNFTITAGLPTAQITYPSSGLNISDPSPLITFVLTDDTTPDINYTIFVNDTANGQNGTVTNGSSTNLSISPALDIGDYTITVQATDDDGNSVNSTPITITIVPPLVYLVSPENNYADKDGDINFTFYVVDPAHDNLNCSLYINDILNQTNSSTNESINTTFEVSGIAEGTNQTWKVECIDPAETAASNQRTFTVDKTKPSIELNSPDNDYTTNETVVYFNWTATDNIDTILLCNLTIDGIVNMSDYYSPNGSAVSHDVQGFADGSHSWNVTCWDDATNANTSETRNFSVDTLAPTINITYPVNGSTYYELNLTLNWTFTEDYPNKCWYNLNNNATNTTIADCSDLYANFTAIDSAWNNITMWINDTSNNMNQDNVTFYAMAQTAPNITNVTITPKYNSIYVSTLNDMHCNYTYNDTQGDPDQSTIAWYKNNVLTSFTGATVQYQNTSLAEQWICEVTPYDGIIYGSPINSSYAEIGTERTNITVSDNATIYVGPEPNNYYTIWAYYTDEDDNAILGASCSTDGTPDVTLSDGDNDGNYTHNYQSSVTGPKTHTFICSKTNYQTQNTLIRTVTVLNHPTNLEGGQNATDIGYGSHVNFTANYTDANTSALLTGAACNVSLAGYGTFDMTETGAITYEVIVQFTQPGEFTPFVSCSKEYYQTASDTLDIVNSTDTVYPLINISVNDTDAEYGIESVSIDFNASDQFLDSVIANVTYPNGTLLGQFTNQSEDIILVPANLTLLGRYNITVFANDTSNNVNTSTAYFNVNDTVPPTINISVNDTEVEYGIESVLIDFNASNVGIDLVMANVTYPNGILLQQLTDQAIDFVFESANLTALGRYNITVFANDTSGNTNTTASFFYVNDTTRPSVFDLIPTADSHFNVSDIIEIAANVTDFFAVANVSANITYPNGTSELVELSNAAGDKYNNSFTAPFLLGRYNMTFTANDTSNNINDTEETYFYVRGNTSIFGVDFDTTNFSFASSDYVIGVLKLFNTSRPSVNLSFFSSMNIKKLTGLGANDVWVRIKVDNIAKLEEKLRTVEDIDDEGSTGTKPFLINVSSGEHNITIEFKRTGNGSIDVNDIDMLLGKFETTMGELVRIQLTNDSYNHSSASFVPAFNWTITKSYAAPTYFMTKQTVQGNASSATVDYYFEDLGTNEISPFWRRYLSSPSDIGSVSGVYIETGDVGTHNHTIQSKTSAGTVTVDFALAEFDLKDNNLNLIDNFQVSNPLTNLTSSQNYSAGLHNLVNKTVTIQNGTQYFISMSSSFGTASGNQTPIYFINSSDVPESLCYSKKERYLSSDLDIGNAFIYMVCKNLTVGNSYTFNLWLEVASGETVEQFDESLNGFELSQLDIVSVNVAPITNEITNPAQGDHESGIINITWSAFSDPNGDPVTYNVSLFNSDDSFNQTINTSTSLTNQLFNSSTVPDGDWMIYVEGCDDGDLCSNSSTNFTIDNTLPTINISVNNTEIEYCAESVSIDFNASDQFLDSVIANVTYPNGTLLQQLTNQSVDFEFESANLTALGRYNITVFANDTSGNTNTTASFFYVNDTITPTINISVNDTDVEYGVESVNIDFNASDTCLDSVIANVTYPNGTLLQQLTNQSIDFEFEPANLTALGRYNITVFANDTAGFSNTTTSYFNVNDTIAPTINISVNDTEVEYGIESVSIDFNASDQFLDSTTANVTYPNGTLLGQFTNQSEDIILVPANLTLLGRYNITVLANDTSSNTNTSTSFFNVNDTTAPTWDQTPQNQVTEYNESFSYDVNASDNYLVDKYFINDTNNFAINSSSGLITNATTLTPVIYYLNISVNDTSNNINSTAIQITVQDNIDPVLNITYPINNSTYYSLNLTLNWTYTEDYPDKCWYNLNNNATNTSISDCSSLYVNFTAIESAWNNITMWINDTSNNIDEKDVTFYVRTQTAPNVTNVTISPTYDGANVSTLNNMTCNYTYNDTEGDPDQSTIAWYRNDTLTSFTGATVSYQNTSIGDQWLCEVTPYDSISYGVPVNSSDVEINVEPANLSVSANATIYAGPAPNNNYIIWAYYTDEDDNPILGANCSISGSPSSILPDLPVEDGNYSKNFNWTILGAKTHTFNCSKENYQRLDTISRTVTVINHPTKVVGEENTSTIELGDSVLITANYTDTDTNISISGANCDVDIPGMGTYDMDETNVSVYQVVINFNQTGQYSPQILCSKEYYEGANVFINTINTSDTTPPDITLIAPVNGTYNGNITFSFNASDLSNEIYSCLVYLNSTFNVSNQSSVVTNGTNYINLTDRQNETFLWHIECTDANNITGYSDNRTISIDNLAPGVILSSPPNATTILNSSVEFICNATENMAALTNITLYHNISGSFAANETDTVSGLSNSSTFSLTGIADGSYIWNCLAYDSLGNSGWDDNNFTITIEAEPPEINISINDSYLQSGVESVSIDFNASDLDLDSVIANVTYPNGTLLQELTNQSVDFIFAPANLTAVGRYNITVFANDTFGNANISASGFDVFVFKWYDNRTYPSGIVYYIPDNSYQFNISWNLTADTVYFEHNFTGTLQNYSATGNESQEFYYNYTNIQPGSYIWRSYANDTNSTWYTSEQWTYDIIPLANYTLNGTLVDGDGNFLNASFMIYNSTGHLVYSSNESYDFNFSGTEEYDMQVTAMYDPTIDNYWIRGLFNNTNMTDTIMGGYNASLAHSIIDPSGLNYDSLVIEKKPVSTENQIFFKCDGTYNLSNYTCLGVWRPWFNIKSSDYANYTFSPGDPALSEGNGTFFEDFESGNLSTNNWTTSGAGVAWFIASTSPFAGIYNAEAENTVGESIVETNISTWGYINISFSFYANTERLDAGEYIAADWYNGTAWINVLSIEDITDYTLYSYNLTSNADNNHDLKIRFRCLSSSNNEICQIDNAYVTGTVVDVDSPTINISVNGTDVEYSVESVSIDFNASDPNLDSVITNVTYPNGTLLQELTDQSIDFIFVPANLTAIGRYNITVFANDTAGNTNTSTSYFNVNDTIAPIINISVNDTDVEYGVESIQIDFNASNGLLDSVIANVTYPNGTLLQQLTNQSVDFLLVPANLTAIGRYNITVFANDTSGNINTSTAYFNVNDTIAPTINISLNDTDVEYGVESIQIDFNVSNVGLDSVIANVTYPNGTLLGQFTDQSQDIILVPANLTALGRYNITVFANDTSGNTNTSTSM